MSYSPLSDEAENTSTESRLRKKFFNSEGVFSTIVCLACCTVVFFAISRSSTSASRNTWEPDDSRPMMRNRGLDYLLEFRFNKHSLPKLSNLSFDDTQLLFSGFQTKFSRAYSSESEKATRYRNFVDNLIMIDRNNAENVAAGGTTIHGINSFSDLSQEEFKSRYLTARKGEESKHGGKILRKVKKYDRLNENGIPSNVDWTGIYTTPVNNQGSCGGCWAVSTTEQTESDAIRAGLITPNQPLSFQQLLSCDTNDYGCSGGWTETGLEYVSTYGLAFASEYPFSDEWDTSATSTCSFQPIQSQITVTSIYELQSEQDMVSHVQSTGPLSVCLDASTWQTYTGGVMKSCPQSPNHCVQAVGVNTAESYWKVRNSWGTEWGQAGFIFLELGENICYITADPQYTDAAIVEHATVVIDIVSASALKNRNFFTNSNPYVVITLGDLQVSTTTIHENLNPVWNEAFTLAWDGISTLQIQVMDKGFFLGLENIPLGNLNIDLLNSKVSPDKPQQFTEVLDGYGAGAASSLTFMLTVKPLGSLSLHNIPVGSVDD